MTTDNDKVTFEDLKTRVHADQGVTTVEAWELRQAIGAGRLTERINGDISDTLSDLGLGHIPYDPHAMPTNQYELVRIYDRTTVLGKVITAANEIGRRYDEYLRETIDYDGSAAEILNRIRILVDE